MPFSFAKPTKDRKTDAGNTADHRKKDPKAGLRGLGFAAGEAALVPPGPAPAKPVRPAGATPARPVGRGLPPVVQDLPPVAKDLPIADAQAPAPTPAPAPAPGLGIFADDLAPAPTVATPGGIFADDLAPGLAPAPGTGEKLTAEEIKEREIARATTQWCDPKLDNRDQVEACVKKGAKPDNFATHLAQADNAIAAFKRNPAEYARHAKTMSDDDMRMVALYTTQAAYPINAMLRGLLKSKPWVDAYGPYVERITKALAKVPKGALNTQARKTIDPKKKDDALVKFDRLYRNDDWNPVFEQVFADEYHEGRVLEDPAFFSATLIKDSYKPSAPVKRTIEGVSMARSITSLSGISEEREALFPPGIRLQIVSIERENRQTKERVAVKSPATANPIGAEKGDAFNNGGRFVWHIRLKQVGQPPAPGAKKESPAKDKDALAPAPSKSSFLEKLLGVGHTVD